MILVDHQIRESILSGMIEVTPINLDNINPNSLDLTLSNKFLYYGSFANTSIDPYNRRSIEYGLKTVTGSYRLKHGEFILGSTIEKISLPDDICAELNGKSSLARLGLQIHQTGGWIDCGFSGNITLEIYNSGQRSIILKPGMLIGQLVFHQTERAEEPYGSRKSSKYQDQAGPVASKYYLNKC